MPRNRKNKFYGLAEDEWFSRNFDATEKVCVYRCTGPSTCEVVEYCDTVSDANTSAELNMDGQIHPKIVINWGHSDIAVRSGHPDAREDLPNWIDEVPIA